MCKSQCFHQGWLYKLFLKLVVDFRKGDLSPKLIKRFFIFFHCIFHSILRSSKILNLIQKLDLHLHFVYFKRKLLSKIHPLLKSIFGFHDPKELSYPGAQTVPFDCSEFFQLRRKPNWRNQKAGNGKPLLEISEVLRVPPEYQILKQLTTLLTMNFDISMARLKAKFPAQAFDIQFFPGSRTFIRKFFQAPGHLCTKILLTPRMPGGLVRVRIERDIILENYGSSMAKNHLILRSF